MSIYSKDRSNNIRVLAGTLTKRENAKWFLCQRSEENGVEYYTIPVEAEEYYKSIESNTVFNLGFNEPNTTTTPKIRYKNKILDLYDITAEDHLIRIGSLNGVYQTFTKKLSEDLRMYIFSTTYQGPQGIQGLPGPKGEPGKDGVSVSIMQGIYFDPENPPPNGASETELPIPNFEDTEEGHAYVVDDSEIPGQYDLWMHNVGATTWTIIDNWGGIPGPTGPTGKDALVWLGPSVAKATPPTNGMSIDSGFSFSLFNRIPELGERFWIKYTDTSENKVYDVRCSITSLTNNKAYVTINLNFVITGPQGKRGTIIRSITQDDSDIYDPNYSDINIDDMYIVAAFQGAGVPDSSKIGDVYRVDVKPTSIYNPISNLTKTGNIRGATGATGATPKFYRYSCFLSATVNSTQINAWFTLLSKINLFSKTSYTIGGFLDIVLQNADKFSNISYNGGQGFSLVSTKSKIGGVDRGVVSISLETMMDDTDFMLYILSETARYVITENTIGNIEVKRIIEF